jgi:tRNA dimethylallyltransferase
MRTQSNPVIAIVGPTATGKTGLSVQLAKCLNKAILSADSRLVYQELAIGTAKPSLEEQQGVPHHLMDLVPPTESYSVARYCEEGSDLLQQFISQNAPPVVVGGTGFYLRGLLEGIYIPPVPPDPVWREKLLHDTLEVGSDSLHARLQNVDPQRANDLHPNDHARILRALEIVHVTGRPVPRPNEENHSPDFPVLWVGLTFEDRDKHRTVIDQRIDAMLKQGWLEEVSDLLSRYPADAPGLKMAHGYPEWIQYLQGGLSYSEAYERIRLNIHQYARRQMTWFQKNPAIHWFDVGCQPIPQILTTVQALALKTAV